MGRYTQSDPIGLAGGVNTYGYVRGQPTSKLDPLGLQELVLPRPWAIPETTTRPVPWFDPIVPMVPDESLQDVRDESLRRELEQCPRDCRGYLRQMREHEEKLRQYQLNPDAHDNLGFLRGADTLGIPGLRDTIIQRRIRKLQGQIDNFRRLYEKCMANGPIA